MPYCSIVLHRHLNNLLVLFQELSLLLKPLSLFLRQHLFVLLKNHRLPPRSNPVDPHRKNVSLLEEYFSVRIFDEALQRVDELRSPTSHMATGCSDGTLKLWRSNSFRSSSPHFLWELVGMFVAHQGPISAISLTDCGQRIATICMVGHLSTASTLRIWELLHSAETRNCHGG